MTPRILIWDIETGFMKAFVHNRFYQNGIPPNNLIGHQYIISVSYMWLGEKKIHNMKLTDYKTFSKNPHDDKQLVKDLYKVLEQADALIHHYGDRFDLPTFNTRAIYHRLKPLHKHVTIDTCLIAKKHFKFNSNRLDYLGAYLGVGRKIKNEEGLWQECYNGSVKAVKDMATYNDQDVQLLHDVYQVLAPFAEKRLNRGLFTDGDELVCPNCGGNHLHQRGYYYTSTAKKAKFQCQDCGSWSSARTSEKHKPRLK